MRRGLGSCHAKGLDAAPTQDAMLCAVLPPAQLQFTEEHETLEYRQCPTPNGYPNTSLRPNGRGAKTARDYRPGRPASAIGTEYLWWVELRPCTIRASAAKRSHFEPYRSPIAQTTAAFAGKP